MELGVGLGVSKTRKRSGGITPDQISDLEFWIDGSDTTTINGGVVENDDPIFKWNDKSGNDHHVIQNTFISQPLWKQSGFGSNSKSYIQMDGINDFMDIPNNINTDTDMTVIALVKKEIFNGTMQTLDSTLGGAYAYGSFGVDVYQRTRVGFRRLRCGQPPPLEFCAGYDTGEIITTNTATGLDFRFYKNGIEMFYGYTPVSSVRVDNFDLLCDQSGSSHGRIAEVIMYNRVLSSDERELLRNYLLKKYGTLTPHS